MTETPLAMALSLRSGLLPSLGMIVDGSNTNGFSQWNDVFSGNTPTHVYDVRLNVRRFFSHPFMPRSPGLDHLRTEKQHL